jgi:enterobactin synthetase component D
MFASSVPPETLMIHQDLAMFILPSLGCRSFTGWMCEQVLPDELQDAAWSRQQSFLAGRYCAAQAMQQLGVSINHLLRRLDDRRVDWPTSVVGSISHSGDLALAVVGLVTHWRAVGVDIQKIMTEPRALLVCKRVMSEEELGLIKSGVFGTSFAESVTRLFSIKETVYKLLYGIAERYMPFSAVSLLSVEAPYAMLRLNVDWGVGWPAGSTLSVLIYPYDDSVLSLAVLPTDHA